MGETGGPYEVYIDDNFHYMEDDERSLDAAFGDCPSAIARCKQIVESSLQAQYQSGMSAEELFERYKSFGDDPSIKSPDRDCTFSAWTFAELRSAEICR
jgi:hypothetical protein